MKKRLLMIAIVAITLVAAYFGYQRLGLEPYRTIMSPNGHFRLVVYRRPIWPSTMPGQGSDARGIVRLYDRSDHLLHEADIPMVQQVNDLEWSQDRVTIPLVFDWELPDTKNSVRASETPWPILAFIDKEQVFIPVLGEVPKNPPQELFGYSWSVEDSSAPKVTAIIQVRLTLNKTVTLMPARLSVFQNSTAPTSQHALVYKPDPAQALKGAQFMLAFSRPRVLALHAVEKIPEYVDSASRESFRVVQLASTEGIHYVLQSRQDEKCIRSVDYYHYLGYDIQPDPGEAFKRALCGQVLTPDKLPEL